MNLDSRIYVAGHRGTAGSAICNKLNILGYKNVITKTREELDLINQADVEKFFKHENIEYVFLCAANPCGIANCQNRADFIYENTMIQNNVIHQSYLFGVKKLLFFGSGYMYPKNAKNPISEELLMSGEMEYNVLPYGVAKISGAVMCESYNLQYGTNFLTIVLNNLYGTIADFDLGSARVLPALIKKFHLAKLLSNNDYEQLKFELLLTNKKEIDEYCSRYGIFYNAVEVWGSGKIKREFIHSDDLADVSIYIMNNVNFEQTYKNNMCIKNCQINVGTGVSYSIKDVALMIMEVVGFDGDLLFNSDKPDSAMDRLMDCAKINSLGWEPKISLKKGIEMMYDWYRNIYIEKEIYRNSFIGGGI